MLTARNAGESTLEGLREALETARAALAALEAPPKAGAALSTAGSVYLARKTLADAEEAVDAAEKALAARLRSASRACTTSTGSR